MTCMLISAQTVGNGQAIKKERCRPQSNIQRCVRTERGLFEVLIEAV